MLKKQILVRFLTGLMLSLSSIASAEVTPKQKLIVYVYDSFIGEWGAGTALKQSFESTCECEIQWVPVADGAAMIARLQIERNSSKVDVLLGIDDTLLATADQTGLFADSGIKLSKSEIPGGYVASSKFVPYDYGYYAFMFDTQAKRKNGHPYKRPRSMDELISSEELNKSVIIQDPRTSAPGLALLLWLHALYGTDANKKLNDFSSKILTVGNGWSETYSLFTKGEAPIVFSYLTSEAYHRESEKTDRYQALAFKGGHYLAIETAAIVNSSTQKGLAKKFLEFLLREPAQVILASTNWMFPVTKVSKGLPASYKLIKLPTKTLRLSSEEVEKHRREWTLEWMGIFQK